MSQLIAKIRKIFASDGALAERLPGYSPRDVQLEMAIAVTTALEQKQILLAEAGTGTGKTYAYLIPSIMSGKKIIISTGTKNLQDQLFHRDIPLIRKTLGVPFKVALLKGRSNYLCLHRLHTYSHNSSNLEVLTTFAAIKNWSEQSVDGEVERFPTKLTNQILPYVTSTTENCLGHECEFFNKCFLFKARRQAQEADVVIINHHLFFADHRLRESSISELLPDCDAVIFDEAHQLPDIATHFLGETLSSRQIIFLARDLQNEAQIEAGDMPILKQYAERLIAATTFLLASFGTVGRGSWEYIVNRPQLSAALKNFHELLTESLQLLEQVAIRGKGLENCYKRMLDLAMRFARLTVRFPEGQVHWYELDNDSFAIHHTPMYVGDYFNELLAAKHQTWIFTSATLSLGGNFSHFEFSLGLKNTIKLHLESPFNFSKQAMMYLPLHNYQPNHETYLRDILEEALPLLRLTKGRTFFLFTSHKALRQAALYLKPILNNPLLVQGEASKAQLLKTFCSMDNAILLGTSSFWEGVDIKDNHLYCVIIDKIPFMVPDDPILKARVDFYKKQGKNPFLEYQLPHAVIAMRQGVGRLIRATSDKGVLMICDPRLIQKDYGKIVLQSLPAMSITHSLDDVATFLQGVE